MMRLISLEKCWKKISAFLLVFTMMLSVTACGSTQTENSTITEDEFKAGEKEMMPDSSSVIGFDFEKQTVMLNSGYEMPIIGLGTWTLSDDEAENSVYHAIKSGMRLIDTARYYGNEVGVGRGLKRAIDEGIVTREVYLIHS